ncbi:cutinase family protein [Gryllotalpicola reticulitermitis]|uniref:Cutinase n=1 Tax=Gryllotalpicola reticulitermitis TaxID=1184153 RepID=A0ABV8Q912_9MICO
MSAPWKRIRRLPVAATAALLGLTLTAMSPTVAGAAGATPAPTPPALDVPAASAPPTPVPAPKTAPTPSAGNTCPDFEFIGARGSGEDNEYSASTRYTAKNPTFGMGGELNDVYQRVAQAAAQNGETVTPYGVPYPAVGIDVVSGETLATGDLSVYTKSVDLGAHAATAELERVSRACPNTGVIVGGYSQGAQAMVDAVLAATPNARAAVVAAVFFGNTYFDASDQADDYGSYDPDLDGYLVNSGLLPSSAIGANGPVGSDWAKAFGTAAIFDYCHNGDPICGLVDERSVGGKSYPVRDFAHIVSANGATNPNILTQHTAYSSAGDTANAAQQLKSLLGLPLGAPSAPTTAELTVAGTATVGTPTTLNAGGSLSDPADPILRYEWSVDAGTALAHTATTVRPRYTTSFDTPGAHRVTVTITTASGTTSSASETLQAVAAPVATPAQPTKVQGVPGDGAATLKWPEVSGADFYAVTDGTGKLLTAFTPLVPGQNPVSWTDTGLKNGSERTYRVYAVNGMGQSRASTVVKVTPHAASQRPVAPPVALPMPNTTLIDPELVWSLGLGLIVVVVGIAMFAAQPRSRRRRLR